MLAKLKSWTDIREEVESNESINEEKFHPVAQEVYTPFVCCITKPTDCVRLAILTLQGLNCFCIWTLWFLQRMNLILLT